MNTHRRALAAAWGEEIRARRQALDLDQVQLAANLGVSQATVSRWETGQMAPGTQMQARLVSELGVDAVSLHRIVTSQAAS